MKVGSTNYFDIAFTNKGNLALSFPLTIPYTDSSTVLSYFDIAIVTNDVVISSIDNLAIGDIFTFQIRIVATNSLLIGDNWIDFRIMAQAGNNATATNYIGEDGKTYGGEIGNDWNGVKGINPGYIYQQGNTNIRLWVYGTEKPLLEITKSVSNIMLGGISISKPIPGATVRYIISYSNAGNGDANNALVYDALPVNTKFMTNYMLAPTTGWTAQYSTNASPAQDYGSSEYSTTMQAKTNIKWVRWIKPSVIIEEKGVLIYRVIIK